jgi:hypothetical protein
VVLLGPAWPLKWFPWAAHLTRSSLMLFGGSGMWPSRFLPPRLKELPLPALPLSPPFALCSSPDIQQPDALWQQRDVSL